MSLLSTQVGSTLENSRGKNGGHCLRLEKVSEAYVRIVQPVLRKPYNVSTNMFCIQGDLTGNYRFDFVDSIVFGRKVIQVGIVS